MSFTQTFLRVRVDVFAPPPEQLVPVVHQGVVAPEVLRVYLRQGTSGVDLTTVTGAYLSVQLPDLTVQNWPLALIDATTRELLAYHSFVTSDTLQLGTYTCFVLADLSGGGSVRGDTQQFRVVSPYTP